MLPHSPAFKLFLYSWVFVEAVIISDAKDQNGFISIDCGLPTNVSYKEKIRGLIYDPDSSLIETGESHSILEKYHENIKLKQHWSLRSFPEGNRNCYKIDVTSNTTYLIRANFVYGNYDGKDSPPEFDLHLGPNHWDSVMFGDSSRYVFKEIIHVPLRSYIHICLVKKDSGIPFISAIDLRPLNGVPYQTQLGPLRLYSRYDIGTSSFYRYPEDVHDRLWLGYTGDEYWTQLNTTQTSFDQNDFRPPSEVLRTAVMPKDASDSLDLGIFWPTSGDETTEYNIYLHFAEVEEHQANQTREFVVHYNENPSSSTYKPFSLNYLDALTLYNDRSLGPGKYYSSIVKTNSSTFPPIINAIEIYVVMEFFQAETNQQDVDAMMNLKSTYGVKRNWQGDPCLPTEYLWEGVQCSYNGNEEPRIKSLDLSSSGLTGEISPYIFNLSILETLDLSDNNLTGRVPDFLAQLPKLKSINLEKNNLKGSVPSELLQKSEDGLLSLQVCQNQDLSSPVSCNLKKKKSAVIPIVASVIGGTFMLLLSAAAIWFVLIRRKRSLHAGAGVSTQAKYGNHREYVSTFDQHESLESRKKEFTFSEIRRITNNFETVLGKGGFGTVYYGYLEEYHIPVAVKMLSQSSYQGSTEFFTEVKLLTRVHHRNLTKFLGYCNDEKCIDDNCNAERCNHIKNTKGLIYEYMAKKDLQLYLSGSSPIILKWEDRLRIAVGAAQGLEYLHHGCKPRIIHRDMKSTNIMLNENFEAKLSDFGISKTFPCTDDRSHLSTVAAGTPGYIDPEYCRSNRLDEKTDVYSFGVVLLEIITGRPAILKSVERNITIIQWVKPMLDRGIIESVVDQRLQGNFTTNSAWKFVEVAMNCVSQNPIKRPTMSEVVGELKESLEIEVVRTKESFNIATENRVEVMPLNFYSQELSIPIAR